MTSLELPRDYQELLEELVAAGVEFVLVGGWAVAVHGHGRGTDDMDVLVRATPENAKRVFRALQRFGAPLAQHGVDEGLFAHEQYGYRFGRKPILIEILTTIDGVDFDEAIADAVHVEVDQLSIPVIGKRALIRNKRASGRAKDLADLEVLEDEPSDGPD